MTPEKVLKVPLLIHLIIETDLLYQKTLFQIGNFLQVHHIK